MLLVTTAAWAIAALLGIVDLYAVHRGNARLERVAKPLAVLAILVAGISSGLLDRDWGIVVLLGLAFGLVGDILLLDESETRFLAGLASFLGGHLLYIAAFVMAGLSSNVWLAAVTVVLVGCLVASRRLIPSLARTKGTADTVAVTAYMVVLGAMTLAAGATGSPAVALGGASFMVSDTLLGMDRFVASRRHAHVAIMATYLLAQALIVGGMARL